jgi:dTDP-glucose pyrophosphorylase
MKVVIMAAGKGTRMLPLTEKVPKVLVEVNGKPFLWYVIENLKKAGFNEFGIIVGYKREQIAHFLKENNIHVTLIQQDEPKGTGHAVIQAKEFIGKEDFILLGGDNLWSVEDFKLMNKKDDYNYVSGVEVKDWKKYGVLVVQDDFLLRIEEKPKEYFGNLINTGLFKFKHSIFSALEKVEVSLRGEIELTDAVSMLAKEKKVKVINAKWWLDMGCKEDLPKISTFLKERF